MAPVRFQVLRMKTLTGFLGILLGLSGYLRPAFGLDCETSFHSTKSNLSEIHRIEERLLEEWGALVRPERLQEFLVFSLTSYRFQASKYERLEVGPAGVQLFRVGTQGYGRTDMIEIPAMFELLHLESLDARPWRKFARTDRGFSNVAFGFASTLNSFKRVLFHGPEGEQVFELSRLDLSKASGSEKVELASRLRQRIEVAQRQGPVLLIALGKTPAQVASYRDDLGLYVFETFQNPVTGREETILMRELESR